MKKYFNILGVALLLAATISIPVYAAVKSDDTVIIRSDQVVDDDLFAVGNEIIVEGIVNGDVYAAGSRVMIRGIVNGDVLAAANNVEVSGTIRDDLRAVGNNVSIVGADIGDSVSVGGVELSIDRDSTIGGGIIFGGQTLSLSGSVGRGVTSGSQNGRIDGPVAKTVRIAAETVNIDSQAVIEGDLEYNSENEATITGTVKGEVIRSDKSIDLSTEGLLQKLAIGFTIWAFLASALIAGLLVILWPKLFKKTHQNFVNKPWPTLGWGSVVLLATIPAVIILLITVIGIPLAALILTFWLVSLYLAKLFVAHSVGKMLLDRLKKSSKDKRSRMYWAILIGLVLYYLLRMLPFFGFFVRLATTLIGLGMILSLGRKTTPAAKKA